MDLERLAADRHPFADEFVDEMPRTTSDGVRAVTPTGRDADE